MLKMKSLLLLGLMNKADNQDIQNESSDFYDRKTYPGDGLPVYKLMGWVCPRCHRVNSPYKLECDCE